MTIPDYQSVMLPLLEIVSDDKEHNIREIIDRVAEKFQLNEEERRELLPSGRQAALDNRVGWARTYLKKADLLDAPKRGYVRITERGHKVLGEKPERIDAKFLRRYPEFVDFVTVKPSDNKGGEEVTPKGTPEEVLEAAFNEMQSNLASEIISQIKSCSSAYFETIVIDVLIRMGYGGSRKEAGKAIGKSGDEGIDGIIKEDKLGLDIIYIQAKRWEATVGRPEIQKFAGALQGKRAKKGIFITTSNFSKDALDYVNSIDSKISLIDGQRLAELMIESNVGVNTVAIYEIKNIDLDYFIEA